MKRDPRNKSELGRSKVRSYFSQFVDKFTELSTRAQDDVTTEHWRQLSMVHAAICR